MGRGFLGAVAMVLGFVLALGTASASAAPKLHITELDSAPAGAAAGDSFGVRGVVQNKGDRAARARVRVQLANGPAPHGDPIEIGQDVTALVRPRKQRRFDAQVTIPDLALDAPADFRMRACAQRANGTGPERCRHAGRISIAGPGARSLGDELFPQTGNGGYDVSHYRIDLDYDPVANEFLPGTNTTIEATATASLTEFSLDFQDIPVSTVTVNGQPAAGFEQVDATPQLSEDPEVTQPMKLVVQPAQPILKNEAFTVEVEYAGTPVLVVDVDQSWEGWIPACYPLNPPQTCDGAFVVNEPNGAQGWFPSNNYPTDKATYETRVAVPASYEAVGIGELVSNDVADDRRTWVWTEDDPTSTYLTTATVGKFIFRTDHDVVERTTGRVLPQFNFIDETATPAQLEQINTALGRTNEMINFLSTRFGPYPYDSGGAVVDRAAGVGYALEVATKPHYAGNFSTGNPSVSQSTHMHELAHQWMGNSVTLENWNDIWFQEGWAQWASWIWNWRDGTSQSTPLEQWRANYTAGAKWNTIPTELNNDPANLFATFPTYTRGAMTYEGYRQIVGNTKFYDFARELTSRFAYNNVSSEDVVDLALEMSGFSGARLTLLEQYFQQWLYEAGQPTITHEDFDSAA